LTPTEYQKAITDLYRDSPNDSAQDRERMILRRELDLTIDHRLGRNFPQERRDALWAIQEQVEKRRFSLTFKYFLRRLFAKKTARDIQVITDFLVKEYAKVLTPEELQQYFGLQPGETPVLPIDVGQFKK
jgi:hypothetical protein